MKKIVTRADDFGSFKTANKAIIDCVNNGIVKNVSIMVVTDYWQEAAEAFKNRNDICLGLHFTINAEWDDINWKPVSSVEQVPSLVTEDGLFRQSPSDQKDASLNEIMIECKSQLELARSAGLNIEYLDTHCGFEWFGEGELRNLLNEFCQTEGLVYSGIIDFEKLPSPESKDVDGYVEVLKGVDSESIYLWIGHPCNPVDEIMNVVHAGLNPGDVAKQRDLQRDMFLNEKIVEVCKDYGVQTVKYTELSFNG
ncbi:MAG: ChbG/HpnK family deacetylase [Kiritimatiellae bacterium]|jgi:hypothetical protein|nr:ChbG/HpnK family deacetylase [Kiritimatiellia bacterium]